VRITTRAKGLAWEAIKVDLFKVEQYDPNYLRLDPGVPTLVHHGKPLSSPPSSAKVARSGPCSLISENSVSEIPKIADELANIIAEVRLRYALNSCALDGHLTGPGSAVSLQNKRGTQEAWPAAARGFNAR